MNKNFAYKNIRILFPLFYILFANLLTFSVTAQIAQARIDTNAVKIGAQVNLRLQVTVAPKAVVRWPTLPDTLGKIEIIHKGKIDTLKNSSGELILKQNLTLTSFDSGSFTIQPFSFFIKNNADTAEHEIETGPLTLHVSGISVDTTKEIKDIKPPVDVPFSWKDFLRENAIYFGAGLLLVAIAAVIYYWLKNRRKIVMHEKPADKRPAHEIALESLSMLEKEKLWQEGRYKEYHIRMADIVRLYIESRFNIPAMELTTEETLSALSILSAMEKEGLRQLLVLADFVKFAKATPIAVENEMSLKNAYQFINSTKITKDAHNEEVKS